MMYWKQPFSLSYFHVTKFRVSSSLRDLQQFCMSFCPPKRWWPHDYLSAPASALPSPALAVPDLLVPTPCLDASLQGRWWPLQWTEPSQGSLVCSISQQSWMSLWLLMYHLVHWTFLRMWCFFTMSCNTGNVLSFLILGTSTHNLWVVGCTMNRTTRDTLKPNPSW